MAWSKFSFWSRNDNNSRYNRYGWNNRNDRNSRYGRGR
jgi:hypothetical protein